MENGVEWNGMNGMNGLGHEVYARGFFLSALAGWRGW